MPNIKDDSTVRAIAETFCGEGKRNKTETLRLVGYSKAYYLGGRSAEVVWGNERVKASIVAIDAANQVETGHNYEIAVLELRKRLAYIEKAAASGNIQAVQAQTAILRELNAITGLHKQTIQHKGDVLPQPTEAQGKALDGFAREYKLRLATEPHKETG